MTTVYIKVFIFTCFLRYIFSHLKQIKVALGGMTIYFFFDNLDKSYISMTRKFLYHFPLLLAQYLFYHSKNENLFYHAKNETRNSTHNVYPHIGSIWGGSGVD